MIKLKKIIKEEIIKELSYDDATIQLKLSKEMKSKFEKIINDFKKSDNKTSKEMVLFAKKKLKDIETTIKHLESVDKQ